MDYNFSNKRRSEPDQAGSLDAVVSTPICDKAKIEVLHCTQDPRKTRARRLAESGLTFWDAMREEKVRRATQPDN